MMNIGLLEHQAAFVQQQIKAGGHASPQYKAEFDASLDQAIIDIEECRGKSLDEVIKAITGQADSKYELA